MVRKAGLGKVAFLAQKNKSRARESEPDISRSWLVPAYSYRRSISWALPAFLLTR